MHALILALYIIFLPLVATPPASPTLVADAILAAAPVAYWPLDETSGTVALDASGNGHDGAYSGAVGLATAPAPFVAPTFGGGYVDIYSPGLAAAFDGDAGTLIAFVQTPGAFIGEPGIVNMGASAWRNIGLSYVDEAGAPSYVRGYRMAATPPLPSAIIVDDDTAVAGPTWMMLALTWDRSAPRVELFVDGVSVSVNTAPQRAWGTLGLASGRCVIGAASAVPDLPLSGGIAHVALWDRVLSPADIAAIYAASGL